MKNGDTNMRFSKKEWIEILTLAIRNICEYRESRIEKYLIALDKMGYVLKEGENG